MLKFLLFFLFAMLSLGAVYGQITWNTSSTGSLSVPICMEPVRVSVEFSNISGQPLTNDTLRMQLPPGVFYVAGSVVDSTGFNVRENNISNLNTPRFLLDDLPVVGGTVRFSFLIRANCAALAHIQSGGVLSNTYTLSHRTGVFPSHTTPAYNAVFPAVDFISISPTNYTAFLGETYNQTVVLSNGGNGSIDRFFLALNPTLGLAFSAPSVGTMNATNDTIFFTGSALGADNLYTSGERITVTYSVTVNQCTNLSTTLRAGWGCGGNICPNTSGSAMAANVPQVFPNLVYNSTPRGVTCFGERDTQTVRIINTAAAGGIARNVSFEINNGYPGAIGAGYLTAIDTATITIQTGANGSLVRLSPASIQMQGGSFTYTTAGTGIGRVVINLPNINPNDTVFVRWGQIVPCAPNIPCNGGITFYSWSYRLRYTDQCQTNNYDSQYQLGSASAYNYFSTYGSNGTAPSTLVGGTSADFKLTIGEIGFGLSNPSTNGYMEIVVAVPRGLVFDNNPGDVQFLNKFAACPWAHNSITTIPGAVSDTVVVRYNFNNRPGCVTNNQEFYIRLRGNCAASYTNPLVVSSQIRYNFYPTCPSACVMRTYCTTFSPTTLQCPQPCANGGIQTNSFDVLRFNLGAPDNNNDGLADGAGSLNMSVIRFNTIIQGDTLQTTSRGRIVTAGSNPTNFQQVYADIQFNMVGGWSNQFAPLTSQIIVYDVSSGLSYTGLASMTTVGGGVFRVDVRSCACLPLGFVFENADSIVVRNNFRLTAMGPGGYSTHTVNNLFYASQVSNPTAAQRFACDTFRNNFETISWYYTNCCGDVFTSAGCNNVAINQNIYLSIGPCCSNYAGGNYFRNEIRQFSFPDTMEVLLPVGYTYNAVAGASFQYCRTGNCSPVIAMAPIDPNANPLKFPLGNFFTARGGTLLTSDEGWYLVPTINLTPSCASPTTFNPSPTYIFDMVSPSSFFNVQGLSAVPDPLIYNAPDLDLQPVTLLIDANDTLRWTLRVENTANNANANNSFLAFRSRLGTINVYEVVDLTTNTAVPNSGGIFQLGTRSAASNRNYSIRSTQSTCILDTLVVYTGYNCSGYPTNLAAYTCSLDSTLLFFKDPSTELQLLVTSPSDSVRMCDTVPYTVELTSAKASPISNMYTQITFPTGLNFINGTVEYEYPLGSGFQPAPNPTFAAGVYTFNVAAYNTTLSTAGLVGTIDAASTNDRKVRFRFKSITDCSFLSGDAFTVRAGATSVCGAALPVLNFDVAPILIRGSVATPYVTQINLRADEIAACGSDHPYYQRISVTNLGPQITRGVDDIILRLPTGIYMVAYDPLDPAGRNAPLVQPVQTAIAGGTELRWPMTNAVAIGDSIVFRIRLEAINNVALCGTPLSSTLFTAINSNVVCISTGAVCASQVANGAGAGTILVNRPRLTVNINNGSSRNFLNAGTNTAFIYTDVTSTMVSFRPDDTLAVDYYCDNNANGTYNVGDVYLGSQTHLGGITAGSTANIVWNGTFPLASCDPNNGQNIIAVVRDTAQLNGIVHCACQYAQRPTQNILLPVGFYSSQALFNANCSITVSWQTETETNAERFEIYRSANGINFQLIATQNAIGNSYQLQNYSFIDETPLAGMNYYKIKAIDRQQSSRSTNIFAANNMCTNQKITVFPVPSYDELNIQLQAAANEKVNVQIINALGQIVWVETRNLTTGLNNWSHSLDALPAGTYTLKIYTAAWTQTANFIKIQP